MPVPSSSTTALRVKISGNPGSPIGMVKFIEPLSDSPIANTELVIAVSNKIVSVVVSA